MRRRFILRFALVTAACAVGCSPTTSPLDLVGTYTLRSVAGQPLPYLVEQAGQTRVEVVDDLLILASGSTYSEVGHKRITSGGITTVGAVVDAGSFSRRNNDITMGSLLIGSWRGTVEGNTLTLVQQGLTLVYQK